MANDGPPTPPPSSADAIGASDLEQRVRQILGSVNDDNFGQRMRLMTDLIESLNDDELIKFLQISAIIIVERGGSVDFVGAEGVSLLLVASVAGKVDFARYLLSHGANVALTDATGNKFALREASVWGRLELCRVLVEEGRADVNQQANDGSTPLICASMQGHLAIVQFLIEKGADSEHADAKGYNSLMHAAKNGKTDVAQHLLMHGVRTDQIGNDGKRARELGEESGSTEMVNIFCAAAERQI